MTPATPSAPRRSAAEQARVDAMLRDAFEERIRFNTLIGLRVASLDPHRPALRFAMRPDLVGHYLHGRLHGGVIATALDTVGGLAVAVGIAEKFASESMEEIGHRLGRLGTIDLRVDYLAQGVGAEFTASAELTRLGGRIASLQMRLVNQDDVLIATGAAAYIVS